MPPPKLIQEASNVNQKIVNMLFSGDLKACPTFPRFQFTHLKGEEKNLKRNQRKQGAG